MVMMMNVKLDDVDDDSGQTVKEKRKGRIEAEDDDDDGDDDALWSGTNKNRDVSTGPLARPFARRKVNDWMAILSVFFPIFNHSAPTAPLPCCSAI